MGVLRQLWQDEAGSILSAEVATVATVGVVGTVVGLNGMATAVNGELDDLTRSFRSLDQSYSYQGFRTCRAYCAGSSFRQQPVDKSLDELCARDEGSVIPEIIIQQPAERPMIDPPDTQEEPRKPLKKKRKKNIVQDETMIDVETPAGEKE